MCIRDSPTCVPFVHRGVDPETGHYFDDTKRYVDALGLNGDRLAEVYEGNARRVYPRLDAALKSRS